MTGDDEKQQPTTQLPEGAGGEEADLHTLVPDNLFRQAERPGRLRDALEARAAALNFSVESVFHRLLANCFIRSVHALPGVSQGMTASCRLLLGSRQPVQVKAVIGQLRTVMMGRRGALVLHGCASACTSSAGGKRACALAQKHLASRR